jgi:hypothetical protein
MIENAAHKLILSFILFVLLVGCASAQSQNSQGTPSGNPNQPTGSKSQSSSTDPVIVYHRSGGIAGLNQTWTIYADGRVITPKNEVISLDAAKVSALLASLQSAGVLDSKGSSGPMNVCPDCMTYEITLTQGGKTVRLVTTDGAQNVPESTSLAFQKVGELIAALPQK